MDWTAIAVNTMLIFAGTTAGMVGFALFGLEFSPGALISLALGSAATVLATEALCAWASEADSDE